ASPTTSSSRATARLTEDFSRPRRSAAAEKVPSSATARKGGTRSREIVAITQQYVAKARIFSTRTGRYPSWTWASSIATTAIEQPKGAISHEIGILRRHPQDCRRGSRRSRPEHHRAGVQRRDAGL